MDWAQFGQEHLMVAQYHQWVTVLEHLTMAPMVTAPIPTMVGDMPLVEGLAVSSVVSLAMVEAVDLEEVWEDLPAAMVVAVGAAEVAAGVAVAVAMVVEAADGVAEDGDNFAGIPAYEGGGIFPLLFSGILTF